jgi:hypothetical protein
MKSSRTISHVRCQYETDVSRQGSYDEDRDGPRKVSFTCRLTDEADSPIRHH